MKLLQIRLNRKSFIPLYSQIYTAIAGMIQRGQFKTGDSLPSEHQLCHHLGVSRHTVRQALTRLGREGLIVSQAGKGTFVASKPPAKHLAIALLVIGFSEQIYQSRQGVYGSLVRGVAEVTAAKDVLFNIFHFPLGSEFAACLGSVEPTLYDGILVRTYENIREEDIRALEELGLPYVIIKRRIPGQSINAVLIDEVKGGFLAADHLAGLGHRRIAVIAGPREIQVFADRIAGAEQALAARGLTLDPDLVRTAPNSIDEDGFRCAAALLARPSPPHALFVASDLMALGAYEAIRQRGLRIPEDISVVGFDDIEVASRLSPPLTTIRTSYFDLGQSATSLLLEILARHRPEPVEILMEPTLVVRESTTSPTEGET